MAADEDMQAAPGAFPEMDPRAFAECPGAFFQGMTPEEFRAKQQLYQVAFERARREVLARRQEAWLKDMGLDLGAGI